VGAGLRLAQVERSSTVEIAPYTGRSIVPPSKNNPILGWGIASSPTKESLHKSWLRQKHEKVKLSSRPRPGRAQPDGKKRTFDSGWTGHSPVTTQDLGESALCRSTTIVGLFLTFKKTIAHSSSHSQHISDGSCPNQPVNKFWSVVFRSMLIPSNCMLR